MEILVGARLTDGPELLIDVSADPDALMSSLLAEMRPLVGAPEDVQAWNERTRHRLDPARPIAEADLRAGDGICLCRESDTPSWAERDPTVIVHRFELVVVGGPDAGRRVPLHRGEATVGRSSDSTLVVDDPDVSRDHLHLGIGVDEVWVTDLNSTNGTDLDGRPIEGTVPLTPGQVLSLGRTVLALRDLSAERGRSGNVRGRDGVLEFSRPPRVARPASSARVVVPDVPIKPGGFRIPMSAALAPVLMGGVMAIAIGPQMLLFALMGPVMMLFTTWEDRRSGHAAYRSATELFEREIVRFADEADAAHVAVVAARRAAGPDAADLVSRAVGLRSDLWERRGTDDDFLALRVGVADPPSAVRFDGVIHPAAEEERAAMVRGVIDRCSVDADVPLLVELARVGVVGVTGSPSQREALLRWWIVQLATLHSHRELGIAVICDEESAARWSWVRWLPHVRRPGSEDVVRWFGAGENGGACLAALLSVVESRELAIRRAGPANTTWFQPVVAIVAGTPVASDALDRLLAAGPGVGVRVVVTAGDRHHLPGRTRSIVELEDNGTCSTVDTSTGDESVRGVTDGVSVASADLVARALAPLRDATVENDGGVVPERALLPDLLGLTHLDADALLDRWGRHGLGEDLGAPIGLGARGSVTIDLRKDGPHGLVAGTTGAGKSELLQSFVLSLAATYPPQRLTFVLVDYKGGAAFKDCVDLPHTVGFFTDLDAHLAHRALVSLNAELRYREEVLREHGAKDLIDLERAAPGAAPPNLLIVFDEFAFLKREVPEFVAGVIDIAQRGRSLGVHLLLATQRPTGVVDDNIRANTNLRIALRMADESDSTDVIDRADAAHIPRSIPGRAFLRVGHGDVRPVQSAYANARSSGSAAPTVVVRPLDATPSGARIDASRAGADDGPTDLQRLVAAIGAATARLDSAELRRPWLPALSEHVDLSVLARQARPPAGSSELVAILGTADQPEHQRQVPWFLDLGDEGHCLVFGTAGAGKTTMLRSVATSLSLRLGPEDLHVYGIDMAGRGLAGLEVLPSCGGIASADEPERIERLFGILEELATRRANELRGAGSLHEFRSRGGRLPYVVVLVDGFASFAATYSIIDGGAVMEQLTRLIGIGRTVGIHMVIAADRRNSVSAGISSSVSSRFVMRLADADEYASFGLPMDLGEAHLPPGRGFVAGGDEVQIAVCGSDHSGPGQTATIARWATVLADRFEGQQRPIPLAPLPARVVVRELDVERRIGSAAFSEAPIGLSGISFRPAVLDLSEQRAFMVAGPDRSGRSTALVTIADAVRSAGGEHLLVAPRRSPLRELDHWTATAFDLGAAGEVLARAAGSPGPLVLVIDDGDELVDTPHDPTLVDLVRRTRDYEMILLAAVRTHVAHRVFGGWVGDLRKVRHGLLLQPDVDSDGDLFGVRLPRKANRRFPPGRGYLVGRGPLDFIQVAVCD